jgi:hypothetical protein
MKVGGEWEIVFFDDLTATEEDKNANFRTKIEADFQWDEQAMQDMAHAIEVYLVPCKVFLHQAKEALHLESLVLLPTHSQNGQFRRIDWFEVIDSWRDWDAYPYESDLNPPYDLNNSPREASPEVVVDGINNCPGVKNPGQHPSYFSLLQAYPFVSDAYKPRKVSSRYTKCSEKFKK